VVRFLQRAAVGASSDVGFSDAWYAAAGTVWIVHRTFLRLLAPARVGERLEVSTWVADLRRVRSRRMYEVRRDGALVATAESDWVYFDRVRRRPARIPGEMLEAFAPENASPAATTRETLELRDASGEAVASARRVELRDLDAMAHVNNAAYVDFVVESVFAVFAARGWPLGRLLDEGVFPRPEALDVEYLDEARHGDELACRCRPRGGELSTEIRRVADDAPIARARSRWSWTTP
jgi:acyl-CoA thioester hydrolase